MIVIQSIVSSMFMGQSASFNPLDSTTYYFNNVAAIPANAEGARNFSFDRTGIINEILLNELHNVTGSAQTSDLYLRNITDASDQFIGTFLSNGSFFNKTNFTGLNISVDKTKIYSWKVVPPAWSTNPTLVQWAIYTRFLN